MRPAGERFGQSLTLLLARQEFREKNFHEIHARMGRTFLIAVLALVVGTVLGALQPRGELLESRAERDQLVREAKSCKRGAASAGITELLRGAHRPAEPDPAEAPNRRDMGERDPGDGPVNDAVVDTPERADDEERMPGLEDPEAMRAALDARAAQARAALIEQADPSEEELAAIDAALEKMNTRLSAQVEAFVKTVEGGREPERRELMEFAAEALDAVIEADDVFAASIDDETRNGVDDETLDPFSYIDGSTLQALQRLEMAAGE